MLPANESKTTTDSIAGFVEAIRVSTILSERLREKFEAIVAEGDCPAEPAELASSLVKNGVLSEYQARQVLKGKPQSLVFGGYVILDFLGKGTMGKVYKASHRMMGRVVALKILDSRYVSNPRVLARFRREMQLVGRLDHPNVVRAFDADRIGDCHFIAMEYVAGPTLEGLLKERGVLPPADVVYFASQAADGLAHAHAQGVLHRDVKPSNLLLTEGRKIKVLDFGLGTLLEKEDLPTALTSAGFAVGTPDYISPEQARMLKIDGRSDLYSLGCTMYHLLSGQLPFKGESSMDCIVSRIAGQAVPIGEVRPGLPPRLTQAIEKLMATSPDNRYQTAEEAAAALRSLLRPKNAAPVPSAPTGAAIAPGPVQATDGSPRLPAPSPTVEAIAPEPEPGPVPEGSATLAAPLPPVRDEVRSSKPEPNSPPSRPTVRGIKAKGALAAIGVAAVLLTVVTIMFSRSSNDEGPAFEQGASNTDAGPVLPPGKADVRPSSPVIEDQKPGATVGMRGEPAGSVPPASGADVRRSSLVIEDPKPGATVGMREDLTGRIESEGWPVVFVQADIPGQPWWCQAAVAKVEGGKFSTKVVFGDELTPSGTKFRIAGIVTPTREEALKFAVGSKQPALPEGFPRSTEVVVTHR
jgi:eukaryotic-like serine/threonine-protein kinase